MKSIVCFGDSNTYGHDPATGDRLPDSVASGDRISIIMQFNKFHKSVAVGDRFARGKSRVGELVSASVAGDGNAGRELL